MIAATVLRWRQPEPAIVTRWRGQRRGAVLPPGAQEMAIAAIIGPPGRDGSGEQFVHHQADPSIEWIVNHNFAAAPAAVAILSPGGLVIGADIYHASPNQFRVQFVTPQAGSVRCSR